MKALQLRAPRNVFTRRQVSLDRAPSCASRRATASSAVEPDRAGHNNQHLAAPAGSARCKHSALPTWVGKQLKCERDSRALCHRQHLVQAVAEERRPLHLALRCAGPPLVRHAAPAVLHAQAAARVPHRQADHQGTHEAGVAAGRVAVRLQHRGGGAGKEAGDWHRGVLPSRDQSLSALWCFRCTCPSRRFPKSILGNVHAGQPP